MKKDAKRFFLVGVLGALGLLMPANANSQSPEDEVKQDSCINDLNMANRLNPYYKEIVGKEKTINPSDWGDIDSSENTDSVSACADEYQETIEMYERRLMDCQKKLQR